jgi:hypothetical protein
MPSHLICGDGAIVVMLPLVSFGMDIDGKRFWSFFHLVKWISSHFLMSIERPFFVSQFFYCFVSCLEYMCVSA